MCRAHKCVREIYIIINSRSLQSEELDWRAPKRGWLCLTEAGVQSCQRAGVGRPREEVAVERGCPLEDGQCLDKQVGRRLASIPDGERKPAIWCPALTAGGCLFSPENNFNQTPLDCC